MSSPPSLGAALLRQWREQQSLTQAAAATRIGIDPWYLAKFERGARKPGRVKACDIERVTEGKVPVSAWDEPAPTPVAPAVENDESKAAS